MKTICILVQNYYEIDIRVRRKAEALVTAGYSVDVLALASSFSKEKSYKLNGVNVTTLSLGKQRGSLLRYIYEYAAFFIWCFFKLTFSMERRRYSIIDVNNLPDFLVFAACYPRLRGARVVFDMHEITPEFYMSKYGIAEGHWLIRVLKFIERISFNFADHVIAINEPIKKLLESRGLIPGKTTIIMNAVDESLFADVKTSPASAADGKFIMMYHGTLTNIYGLDIAIQGFAKVHKMMPDAEFWILGGGTEKTALQDLCKKLGVDQKVKFIGNVLPNEVPNWLQKCTIGVLATRRDVFLDYSYSNKLSEYIIMDKAVISSRLKAIRHYFGEDALAFFQPNDPADLSRVMLHLYKHPELRAKCAAQAKREYQPLSWDVMKERYLAMTDRLAGAEATLPAPSALPKVVSQS